MEKCFASLKDKVVVITGGTRGIGYETSKAFLEQGAIVNLFGSREETVQNALKSLHQLNPNFSVKGYWPDLNNLEQLRDTVKQIHDEFGRIDVLINNAGVSDSYSIYDYDNDHFDSVMNINLKAVFEMCRAVAPYMRQKKQGVILNSSSMVSLYAQRSGSAYPTSKFAVNGLTKSLARELGQDGIRINAVAPGIIETDMVAALDQNIIQAMAKSIPLQRIGKPEDIANAFLFLASDMAAYITGAVLSVDGGFVG